MKRKIGLYGAGNYFSYIHNILSYVNDIEIVAVFDSDNSKWGTTMKGISVTPPDNITVADIDGVYISVENKETKTEIKEKIASISDVRVYENIADIIAPLVYWDITSWCNAKCKYCVTGRKNREKGIISPKYMNIEEFESCYEEMYKNGIISKMTRLCLFNWDEPFLNPDLPKILSYCSRQKQVYSLSTNGSIIRKADNLNTYEMCDSICFSMPGFSQDSYDKIHGFDFCTIKKNIDIIREDMISHGFKGTFYVAAHQYKFSKSELSELENWATERGFIVNAYEPYLAGNSLMIKYIEGELSKGDYSDIENELNIDIKKIPKDEKFDNPFCNILTLDYEGFITACCLADIDENGFRTDKKIKDVHSYDELLKIKKEILKEEVCGRCSKYAIGYNIFKQLET